MRNVILGVVVLLLGGQWLTSGQPAWGFCTAAAALLWAVSFRKGRRDKSLRRLQTKDMPSEYAAMVQESWAKALADHKRLTEIQTKIHDGELRSYLRRLSEESSRMLDYLEPRAERVLAARRFIDYYQDRAVSLSEEYQALEQTGLETEQVRQTRARLKETLLGFEAAYAAEFEKILNSQLMDMDAEMSVMQHHFESEGLSRGADVRTNAAETDKEADRQARHDGVSGRWTRSSSRPWRQSDFSIVPPAERGSVIKDKIIVSLLAIFLGAIGAHKFYRGKTLQGVLYVMFCWSFLPAFIGFCEGMHYLFMPVDGYYKKYYR